MRGSLAVTCRRLLAAELPSAEVAIAERIASGSAAGTSSGLTAGTIREALSAAAGRKGLHRWANSTLPGKIGTWVAPSEQVPAQSASKCAQSCCKQQSAEDVLAHII